MPRSVAPTGSALAGLALAFACAAGAGAVPSGAAAPPPLSVVNAAFVGVEDPTLHALLARIGGQLSWHAGSRDVLITTASHTVVAFTVGSRQYHVGSLTLTARYAPWLRGTQPFLPLNDILSALGLRGFPHGRTLLLEAVLASLDIHSEAAETTIVAQAAVPLHARLLSRTASFATFELPGVGAAGGTNMVGTGGVRDVVVASSGTLSTVRTVLRIDLEPGATVETPASDDGRDVKFTVTARAARAPAPAGTRVTAVDVIPSADAFTVAVDVAGNATYAWHHLPPPDNRFWIDISGARLAIPARDDRWIGRVEGVRVRQQAPQRVRVALSLAGAQSVSVTPSGTGVRVVVGNDVVQNAPRGGTGSIGSIVAAVVETPPPAPLPAATALLTPAPYHPSYVPTNPHLIVIDPGHGGNDAGTVAHGLEEKTVTLDIALRLRDILVSRGWQVMMTRTTDTEADPAATTDRDELQARDDVANDRGARAFVSIHVNWYSSPDPHGATTYYSKPEDVQLARDIEDAVAREAGVTNRGIVKSHLYVTLHATMPAALIETAFISNPGDFRDLDSPQWRQRVAQGIADGIDLFAQQNPVPPTPNR
jgi:N-acetylmuramoyl-L-alanine amidase